MPRPREGRPGFAGYHVRPSQQEDAELTHVGRGTPGGEYLRRFWHPVALASELRDLPLALRVLGEDLVLFRDGRGALGLLHRRCSHRGVSLEFGRIEQRGIRCCYHGWLYDVDGRVLETPAEPESPIRHRICHGAYPTAEADGLIFAWLGPPEEKPPLPVYDSYRAAPDNALVPFKLRYPCNWLQVHENTADPMHIPFLHGRASGVQFTPGFSELPALSFADTPLGLAVASTRRTERSVWIRTADVMLPNLAQYPPAFETGESTRLLVGAWATRWIVPIDDAWCQVIGYRHFNACIDPAGQGVREAVGLETVDFAGQVAAPEAERQRAPGDYEAMVGQGPIAIHANEHLVASDLGVVRLRRMLRDGIARVREGRALATRGSASGALATYAGEFVLPVAGAQAAPEPAAVGDLVLAELIESAGDPPEARAKRVAARLAEVFQCR